MRMLISVFALFLLVSPASAKQRHATVEPPPLVRVEAPPPPIQTVDATPAWTFGSWTASDDGDFTLASTVNESGSAFGIACGKTCVWFVNFRTPCEVGQDYPAMINSSAGSYAIQLRCYHLVDRWLLTFPIGNNDADTIVKGGEIGFAFPLQGGKFGVSRFSLAGGAAATLKAINLATEKRQQSQEGLRDFTI